MKKTLAIIALLLTFPSLSHGKVVIVPMVESLKVKNVITVAKNGGDFKDIANALDSITESSPENTYLVQIGPGEFTTPRPITVSEGVSIVGSGTRATVVRASLGGFSNNFNTVFIVDAGAALSNFSIEAIGNGGGTAMAIKGVLLDLNQRYYQELIISNVNITVRNATNNYGINVFEDYTLVTENVSINASSNGTASSKVFGITNTSGLPGNMRINNSNIRVFCQSAASTNCRGVSARFQTFVWLSNSQILSFLSLTQSFTLDDFELNQNPGIAIYVDTGADVRINSSFISGQIIADNPTQTSITCDLTCASEIKIYNSTIFHGTQPQAASLCLNTNNGTELLESNCLPITLGD